MSNDSSNRPPRWAENLVRGLLKPRDRETIAGDLLEQYREAVRPARGRFRADLWYLTQALSIIDGVAWGALLGLAFGFANLLYTWIDPLADDSGAALLTFYGPMFAAWGLAGYTATRRNGRIRDAIQAGTIIALVTFVVFYLANLVRVNLFLETLRGRADWQNMLARFGSSGYRSLRVFINYEYLEGAPFKIGVASFIGATVGLFGGLTARVTRWRSTALKD
jgi:hypothetical protein